MDQAAAKVFDAIMKVKEALDEAKDVIEMSEEVDSTLKFLRIVTLMIPRRASALPPPTPTQGENGEDVVVIQSPLPTIPKEERYRSACCGIKVTLDPPVEIANISNELESRHNVLSTVAVNKPKSIELTFEGLEACTLMAQYSLFQIQYSIEKLQLEGPFSVLWVLRPWKILRVKGMRSDFEKHVRELKTLTALIQNAVSVASYSVQLEQLENIFDSTSVILNVSLKEFWKKNIGRNLTRVPIQQVQEAFINMFRAELRKSVSQYQNDPMVFVMRRVQDYWDCSNRDDEISVFELAELPAEGDEVTATYTKIVNDMKEFFTRLSIQLTSLSVPPVDPTDVSSEVGVSSQQDVASSSVPAIKKPTKLKVYQRCTLKAELPWCQKWEEFYTYDRLALVRYDVKPRVGVEDDGDEDWVDTEILKKTPFVEIKQIFSTENTTVATTQPSTVNANGSVASLSSPPLSPVSPPRVPVVGGYLADLKKEHNLDSIYLTQKYIYENSELYFEHPGYYSIKMVVQANPNSAGKLGPASYYGDVFFQVDDSPSVLFAKEVLGDYTTKFKYMDKYYEVVAGNAMQIPLCNPKHGDTIPVIFHIPGKSYEDYKLVLQSPDGTVLHSIIFEDINNDERATADISNNVRGRHNVVTKIRYNSNNSSSVLPSTASLPLAPKRNGRNRGNIKTLVAEGTYRVCLLHENREVFGIELTATYDDTLPSSWANPIPICSRLLHFENNRTLVTYVSHNRGTRLATLRSDVPIPPQCSFYYFQIVVVNCRFNNYTTTNNANNSGNNSGNNNKANMNANVHNEGQVIIGLLPKDHKLQTEPGLKKKSIGYSGSDGFVRYCTEKKNYAKPYSDPWKSGDVIGCGWDLNTGHVYFTKNGESWNIAVHNFYGEDYYPTVSLLGHNTKVMTNFNAMATLNITNVDEFLQKFPLHKSAVNETFQSGLWCGYFHQKLEDSQKNLQPNIAPGPSLAARFIVDSMLTIVDTKTEKSTTKLVGFGDIGFSSPYKLNGIFVKKNKFKGKLESTSEQGVKIYSAVISEDKHTITGRWDWSSNAEDSDEEDYEAVKLLTSTIGKHAGKLELSEGNAALLTDGLNKFSTMTKDFKRKTKEVKEIKSKKIKRIPLLSYFCAFLQYC